MHDQTCMLRLAINLLAVNKTEKLKLSFSVVMLRVHLTDGRLGVEDMAWDLLSNRRFSPRLKVFIDRCEIIHIVVVATH